MGLGTSGPLGSLFFSFLNIRGPFVAFALLQLFVLTMTIMVIDTNEVDVSEKAGE